MYEIPILISFSSSTTSLSLTGHPARSSDCITWCLFSINDTGSPPKSCLTSAGNDVHTTMSSLLLFENRMFWSVLSPRPIVRLHMLGGRGVPSKHVWTGRCGGGGGGGFPCVRESMWYWEGEGALNVIGGRRCSQYVYWQAGSWQLTFNWKAFLFIVSFIKTFCLQKVISQPDFRTELTRKFWSDSIDPEMSTTETFSTL